MVNVHSTLYSFHYFGLNALVRRLEDFRLDCLHASHIEYIPFRGKNFVGENFRRQKSSSLFTDENFNLVFYI